MGDDGLGVAQVGGDATAAVWSRSRGRRCARGAGRVGSPRTSNDTTAPPRPDCWRHRQLVLRMRSAGRGSRRARPWAAPPASGASSSARCDCACMRMASVSRPLSTTQALNGDSAHAGGAHHRDRTLSRSVVAGPTSAPAITRPWPSRYLVPEWMTRSAPNFDRPLQRRRAEAVVDRQQRAGAVRDVRQRRDVAHVGQRIGRRLGEQQLRVRAASPRATAPTSVCETKVVCTPNLPNSLPIRLQRRAEHRARAHHVVAGLEQAHAQQQDRAHAAGRADRRFGAFERGQPLLESWPPWDCECASR